MALLEGKEITRHFHGLKAVVNVDLSIEQGEIVGLIGPNGAGKTTLFNLISGAIPLTSGTVLFKGENVTQCEAHRICRLGMCRTFQAGQLFSGMSVFDNVFLATLFGSAAMKKKDGRVRTSHLLELVGLKGKEKLLAKDLTLAQQKRLEIARALATNPELLLLDEVMAGLNPTEVAQSVTLIRGLRSQGVTVFLIEHIMKALMGLSDRVVVLHHGEKIAEGTPQEIARSKTVIKVYLGGRE